MTDDNRRQIKTRIASVIAMWTARNTLRMPQKTLVEVVLFVIDAALAELDKPDGEEYWKSAAQNVGENLASAGPIDYYAMGAVEWKDWALIQINRLKTGTAASLKKG